MVKLINYILTTTLPVVTSAIRFLPVASSFRDDGDYRLHDFSP